MRGTDNYPGHWDNLIGSTAIDADDDDDDEGAK
jgi:hypothetical protein